MLGDFFTSAVCELRAIFFVTSLYVNLIFLFISLTLSISKKSKKGGKDQELIQLSTTPDPGYQMGK